MSTKCLMPSIAPPPSAKEIPCSSGSNASIMFIPPSWPLAGTRDAAVLADAPEVDRHEEGGDERDADAVQHVEADQGGVADRPAADQGEPGVAAHVDQPLASQFEEGGTRPLVA